MPIKFKCKCGQVLSVPSKMAGKQGKCPKCKNALKVPAPKAAGSTSPSAKPTSKPAAKPAAKPAPAPASAIDDLLEDAGLVQKTGPICKQCGADIKPGTVVCTACGFNFETGETAQGFNAQGEAGPEFDNQYLQQASENMVRDVQMESRRDKSSMPWWVLMSYLIGTLTLCLAGVAIVDGQFGEPESAATFIGRVQRLAVFQVLGATALITGVAITCFAHLSICFFAFTRSVGQGFACLLLPLIYSIVYGIMNWKDNKAPVKAIISAIVFIAFGVFLIIQGGGFTDLKNVF
ncbi:MAG: hypothetical protein Aurels2KO_29400 [Aureliella sp.]